MRPSFGLTLLLPAILLGPPAAAQEDSLGHLLASRPVTLQLVHGDLQIVNLYLLEGRILLAERGQPDTVVVDRLATDVYRPYSRFWQNYIGDEDAFRRWAKGLLAPDHPIHHSLEAFLRVDLDAFFSSGADWLTKTTGRGPRGTWVLVYGPGWTDMGGFTDGTMVADFTTLTPDSASLADKLPHELTHEVRGAGPLAHTDPDSNTVLGRIVNEGLACYAAFVYARGRGSPARSVGYSEAEWAWAVAHEDSIRSLARPLLSSTKRADISQFAARNAHPLKDGPSALAYFLGFRIVMAYVARHGPTSWVDLIDLPSRTVLERSGYPL